MTTDSNYAQVSEKSDYQSEDVLRFWFPPQLDSDQAAIIRQWHWWFRGGATAEIVQHFAPLVSQAARGNLDDWSAEPRSRLALILVLDQFSRSLYQGTPQAFAQDAKAFQLTLEGLEIGHYAALKTPWEKTFFLLPLGHSENLEFLNLVVRLAEALAQESPQEYRDLLEFSAEQARRHQAVIARFGRHPHRNKVLGRQSTPEELAYFAEGELVHTRSLPPYLLQLIDHAP